MRTSKNKVKKSCPQDEDKQSTEGRGLVQRGKETTKRRGVREKVPAKAEKKEARRGQRERNSGATGEKTPTQERENWENSSREAGETKKGERKREKRGETQKKGQAGPQRQSRRRGKKKRKPKHCASKVDRVGRRRAPTPGVKRKGKGEGGRASQEGKKEESP